MNRPNSALSLLAAVSALAAPGLGSTPAVQRLRLASSGLTPVLAERPHRRSISEPDRAKRRKAAKAAKTSRRQNR